MFIEPVLTVVPWPYSHYASLWWRATWTDLFVRAAAFLIVFGLVLIVFFDPSSLPIGGAGAIAAAILMGIVGAMKATPAIMREYRALKEMEYKHGHKQDRNPRSRMPDSSEIDEGHTAKPPEDKEKIDRVRRRKKKDPPVPPPVPPSPEPTP